MSTELTTRNPNPPMPLSDKMEYARALATANLLPASYRQNPGNVLLAMEFGDALGIPPIQAINDVHIIEGKPSASANLIGAMVRKAGHKLRVTGDDTTATAQIIRADDPEFTFEVTWNEDRARAAGLLEKKGGNWAKYRAAMLKARAITEVARAACPDALYGVIYTPEELGAVVNEDGEVIEAPNPAPARQHQKPAQEAPTQHDPEQLLRDAWESVDRLDKLGRWATQAGWPAEYIDRVRARWTELQTPTPEATEATDQTPTTTTEPIEGVIEDEPEN